MFCSMCGKENPNDSKFCSSCGEPIKTSNESSTEKMKQEIETMNNNANLQMQNEMIRIQQEQLELQHKQFENVVKCPKCGSTSLSGSKKGFGVGKALVGAAVLGPFGLIAGNINAKKVVVTCMNCGHKFKR